MTYFASVLEKTVLGAVFLLAFAGFYSAGRVLVEAFTSG